MYVEYAAKLRPCMTQFDDLRVVQQQRLHSTTQTSTHTAGNSSRGNLRSLSPQNLDVNKD